MMYTNQTSKNMFCHHYIAYLTNFRTNNRGFLVLFSHSFQIRKMPYCTYDILRQKVNLKMTMKFWNVYIFLCCHGNVICLNETVT